MNERAAVALAAEEVLAEALHAVFPAGDGWEVTYTERSGPEEYGGVELVDIGTKAPAILAALTPEARRTLAGALLTEEMLTEAAWNSDAYWRFHNPKRQTARDRFARMSGAVLAALRGEP